MRSVSPYERFGQVSPASDAFLVTHTVDASETITGIAYKHYQDWTAWREIADRNDIYDPRQIAPGTLLLIPERPLEGGSTTRV
jgi:nucleoid-associated protein YgaU